MKLLILLIFIVSCGTSEKMTVNKDNISDLCLKKDVNMLEFSSMLQKIKSSNKKWYLTARCYELQGDSKLAYFYYNKVNKSKVTSSEMANITFFKAVRSLKKFDIIQYERLRKTFKKYKSKDFSLLELHYNLMFSKLYNARKIIRDIKKREVFEDYLGFYEAWFLIQLGKNEKAVQKLDEVFDDENKNHVILNTFLDKVLKRKKNIQLEVMKEKFKLNNFELSYLEELE